MKKAYLKTIILISLIIVANLAFTQGPPDPPGDPGSGGGPVGGSGPIDGGIGFLLAMAAAWGGHKIHRLRKKKLSEAAEE